MKVLETPEYHEKPWTTEVVCIHCGAKLQVEEQDLGLRISLSPQEDNDRAYNFTCPICYHLLYLQEELPLIVQDRISKRRH